MSPTYSEVFQKIYMQRRKEMGREKEKEERREGRREGEREGRREGGRERKRKRKRIYLDLPWTSSELGEPIVGWSCLDGHFPTPGARVGSGDIFPSFPYGGVTLLAEIRL